MSILKEELIVDKILNKLMSMTGVKPALVKTYHKSLVEPEKNVVRLPKTGFIAGGAICNVILSMIDGKDYPINDIDVFYETNVPNTDNTSNRNTETNVYVGPYSELMSLDSRHMSYKIIDTDREGIFNNVFINKVGDSYDVTDFSFVLKGFDINCCMIGIDLSNKKLLYTKDFEEFLTTRQLMVSNPYTPCHTSLRLLKKKEELNVYLNIEKEMNFLSQVYHLFDNPFKSGMGNVFGNFFSEKYKDLYNKYKDVISEYFELLSYTEAKRRSFISVNGPDAMIPNELVGRWTMLHNLYAFYPKKYGKGETYLDFIPNSCRGPISLKKIWNVFERSSKSEIRKAELILSDDRSKHFFFSIEGFHKCDFNEKNIEEFNKIVHNNQILIDCIVKGKLNLQEALDFFSRMKKIICKDNVLFIEMVINNVNESPTGITKSKLMDNKYLSSIFEDEKIKRSKLLTTPLDLKDFEYGSNVYELVTEYDLLFASKKLHNCMANPAQNYDKKIKRNQTKLFLIETENNYSGLELTHNDLGFTFKTILGINNVPAVGRHKTLGAYLINFLNHRFWMLKSNEILNKLDENKVFLSNSLKSSSDDVKLKCGVKMANRFGAIFEGTSSMGDLPVNIFQNIGNFDRADPYGIVDIEELLNDLNEEVEAGPEPIRPLNPDTRLELLEELNRIVIPQYPNRIHLGNRDPNY
jgi:hypothetical protein